MHLIIGTTLMLSREKVLIKVDNFQVFPVSVVLWLDFQ